MNKRYYRNYKNNKSKWYFVSYNFSTRWGKSGFGSIELQVPGKPNLMQLEKYILENNSELAIVNVMHITPTQKNK